MSDTPTRSAKCVRLRHESRGRLFLPVKLNGEDGKPFDLMNTDGRPVVLGSVDDEGKAEMHQPEALVDGPLWDKAVKASRAIQGYTAGMRPVIRVMPA